MADAVNNKTVRIGEFTRLLDVESFKGRVMNIVLYENRAEVDVPVAARGTVDDKWTNKAVGILS